MTQEQKEINNKLKAELFSSDEAVVLKALDSIGEDGDREMVAPVLELLAHTSSEAVKDVVLGQLSELKIGDMEGLFIEKIQLEEFQSYHQQLVSCMWSSGMNPTDDLHVFSKLAVDGDYMTALEVLTLLENMEGPFDNESLMDAFQDVSEFVEEAEEGDAKIDLIKSIYDILYAFKEA